MHSYIKVLLQLPWRNKSNHSILKVFIYSRSYMCFNLLSKQDEREREKKPFRLRFLFFTMKLMCLSQLSEYQK